MNQSNQTQTNRSLRKTVLTDSAGIAYGVEFAFPKLGKTHTLHLDKLSPESFAYAAAHGISQKCGDRTAISRNPETGLSATDQDKYDAFFETFQRLANGGDWNGDREGGGNASLLFKAMCRMYEGKRTPDELREWLAKKTDAQKTALATKNPEIARIIAEIRAERVADVEPPDTSELDEVE